MALPRGLFLTLLATLITFSYAAPSTSHDLTGRSSEHTFVRRAGLVPHVNSTTIDIFPDGAGGYPRLAALSDGSILGSFTAFPGNNTRVLTVTRSTDGGHTFVAHGEIARSQGDLDNLFLLQLANGHIVAAYRNHDVNANRDPTFFRITTSLSRDGGRTWEFLSQVAQRTAIPSPNKNGLWVSVTFRLFLLPGSSYTDPTLRLWCGCWEAVDDLATLRA